MACLDALADEEIAEFRDSMRRGFREVCGWSDADIAEAEGRVRMLNPKGKMGKEFIAYLRRVQRKYHFDLVVINPLQGVAGIDLSQNKELTKRQAKARPGGGCSGIGREDRHPEDRRRTAADGPRDIREAAWRSCSVRIGS